MAAREGEKRVTTQVGQRADEAMGKKAAAEDDDDVSDVDVDEPEEVRAPPDPHANRELGMPASPRPAPGCESLPARAWSG